MSIPYMPLYVADYEADTAHLTLEEDGAYNRLLRLCWRTPGGSIPNDRAWLQRRLRVDDATYERAVAPVLDEFFTSDGGRSTNKRLQAELFKVNETHQKRSAAGKRGGRKPLKNNETDQSRAKAGPKQLEPELEIGSVAKATGASAPGDLTKHLFDSGVRILTASGKSEQQARSILGRWRKQHRDPAIISALASAQREGAVEPVSFVERCLRSEARRSVHQVAGGSIL